MLFSSFNISSSFIVKSFASLIFAFIFKEGFLERKICRVFLLTIIIFYNNVYETKNTSC